MILLTTFNNSFSRHLPALFWCNHGPHFSFTKLLRNVLPQKHKFKMVAS